MIKGRLFVDTAEVKQSKKEGKGNYGIITLIGMGVSPLTMFTSEQMIKNVTVGAEHDVEFKLKGKELDGISKIYKVK